MVQKKETQTPKKAGNHTQMNNPYPQKNFPWKNQLIKLNLIVKPTKINKKNKIEKTL